MKHTKSLLSWINTGPRKIGGSEVNSIFTANCLKDNAVTCMSHKINVLLIPTIDCPKHNV